MTTPDLMKQILLVTAALATDVVPSVTSAQDFAQPFHATSIGVGSSFPLKGSAWGSTVIEGDRLVVVVDSLMIWRDPTGGHDGAPRHIGSIDVGLGTGSRALSWRTEVRSEQHPVDVVLGLDESLWIRDIRLLLKLPQAAVRSELPDRWIVFTIWDRDRSSASHFHSPVRFSGISSATLDGVPPDFDEGIAEVLRISQLVEGRFVSVIGGGEINEAIRAKAATQAIPVCAYVSPTAEAFPSFRLRGFAPRTPDAFGIRVQQFEADGTFGVAITVGVSRTADGGWKAEIEEVLPAPPQPPRPPGQSFCHRN